MQKKALEQARDTGVLQPITKQSFAQSMTSHMKYMKRSLSVDEAKALADGKTISYQAALTSVDCALAQLAEVAKTLPEGKKEAIEVAVNAIDNFVMFNGEDSMSGNSAWEPYNSMG